MSDLLQELVMIPLIIKNENFSLEVLLIEEEEIRCDDGKASWKRKGASIKDRKIVEVKDRILYQNKSDYLKILPDHLHGVFTSRELA